MRKPWFCKRSSFASLAACAWLTMLGSSDAQTSESPRTLYRCTKLADPAKLQECIIEGQGGRAIPGELSSTPNAPDAPIYPDAETPARTVPPLSSGPP